MPDYFEHYKKSEIIDTRRVIHTPSDAARSMFFYIQEAGYLKSLKPHLSKRSHLTSYLYMVVLSGSGTVTYKNSAYDLEASDCILLDCRQEYSHISHPDDPWELLWLHFHGPLAEQYYGYVVSKNGHCFQCSNLFSIIESINRLIEIHSIHEQFEDIVSSQLIMNILTLSVTGSKKNSGIQSRANEKLGQILVYLGQHFTEHITLEQISQQFYMSKYHLAREFKKTYNLTIIQQVLTLRVTYAKELLRFSDLSIEEIAAACGIGDPSYFNKVFKKVEGVTASEYRRMW